MISKYSVLTVLKRMHSLTSPCQHRSYFNQCKEILVHDEDLSHVFLELLERHRSRSVGECRVWYQNLIDDVEIFLEDKEKHIYNYRMKRLGRTHQNTYIESLVDEGYVCCLPKNPHVDIKIKKKSATRLWPQAKEIITHTALIWNDWNAKDSGKLLGWCERTMKTKRKQLINLPDKEYDLEVSFDLEEDVVDAVQTELVRMVLDLNSGSRYKSSKMLGMCLRSLRDFLRKKLLDDTLINRGGFHEGISEGALQKER